MTRTNAPTPARIDQLIATLLAFFGMPVRFALRVLQDRIAVRERFAAVLQVCKRRRLALHYEGESAATVQARIALLEWFAKSPQRALTHLARRVRGWRAFRWAQFGNVPRPVVRAMGEALMDACGPEAPAPDTS